MLEIFKNLKTNQGKQLVVKSLGLASSGFSVANAVTMGLAGAFTVSGGLAVALGLAGGALTVYGIKQTLKNIENINNIDSRLDTLSKLIEQQKTSYLQQIEKLKIQLSNEIILDDKDRVELLKAKIEEIENNAKEITELGKTFVLDANARDLNLTKNGLSKEDFLNSINHKILC